MGKGVRHPAPGSVFSEASTTDVVWTLMDPPDSNDTSLCWALGCPGRSQTQTTLPHACQPWATELLSGDAGTDGLLAVNKPVCREFQGAGLGLLTCSGYLN